MSRPTSPFQFVVSDLMRTTGAERSVEVQEGVDYHIEMARVAAEPPLYAEVSLRSISGGIMVDGTIDYEVELTCHRCLTTWTEPESRRVRQLVEPPGSADAEYQLAGDILDLEPIIRDEATLGLPLASLCRPDCAGLCPTCGADLNTDACPGHVEDIASPFAGLRDLLETQD